MTDGYWLWFGRGPGGDFLRLCGARLDEGQCGGALCNEGHRCLTDTLKLYSMG